MRFGLVVVLVIASGLCQCASASHDSNALREREVPTPLIALPANREPLKRSEFVKLPVGSFQPAGWLRHAMELQRDGLMGNLGEISLWLTKEGNAWLSADGKGMYGWEEVPYWLRGYARVGYLLADAKMIAEANTWIEATLKSQRANGDFGPIQMRGNNRDLWAQMLMLQVLQAHYEFTSDERVLPFMSRYFKWQMTIPDERFLQDYWENSRGGDNLASVYWLYNLTGEPWLLDLASKIDRNTADWRQEGNLPNWHVVNIAECFRAPATFALQSKRAYDTEASYRAFRLAREKYGQVPGGMFGADENARPGHTDPHQAAETCSFVEQILSNRMMMEMTGDTDWASNTEDVAYNSLPAAFSPDYRALRYLTAPNQISSDAANHAPGVANEGPFFLMNPFSSRCCQHNHSSAWVNFAEHAWLLMDGRALCAVLFAEGSVQAKVKGAEREGILAITTTTHYPFDETVTFTIDENTAGECDVVVRIPDWAQGATVHINSEAKQAARASTYHWLKNRAWKKGDVITATLPMSVRVREWERNKNSVSVDYGPLTFSLLIEERTQPVASEKTAMGDSGWQPSADPAKWPSHEILPTSAWNYALEMNRGNPAASFAVVKREWPKNGLPFTNDNAPIVIKAKGRALPGWVVDKHGLAGALPQSPVESDEPLTDLTLVPMGGARLRISAFPVLK